MRGVAYVRVSTREQDEEVQRSAIEEFAKRKGIEITKWYVDKISGALVFRLREGAQQLLRDIEVEKPDCIIAWSLDRLGRNMLDTMNTVLEFENRGIRVVTIKEEFLQSIDSNLRQLLLSIFSWIAEFERRRIRERQEEAWRQGKQKGRPRKVSDSVILKYYNDYHVKKGLSLKDVCRLMNANGYDISYETLKKHIKRLRDDGKIKVRIKVEV